MTEWNGTIGRALADSEPHFVEPVGTDGERNQRNGETVTVLSGIPDAVDVVEFAQKSGGDFE